MRSWSVPYSELPVTNNPYLLMEDLPVFLQKLRHYGGGKATVLGLRLLFLTDVRTGELRLAEPEQFDLDRGIWTIPAVIVTGATTQGG
jgi:integrase